MFYDELDMPQFEAINQKFWADGGDPPDDPTMFIGLLRINHNGASGGGYGTVLPVHIRRSTLEAYRSNNLLYGPQLALGEPVPRPLTVVTLLR